METGGLRIVGLGLTPGPLFDERRGGGAALGGRAFHGDCRTGGGNDGTLRAERNPRVGSGNEQGGFDVGNGNVGMGVVQATAAIELRG